MTVVVDASAVVAALVDRGPLGRWAEAVLQDHDLAAPYLMHAEAVNVLRRAVLAGRVPAEVAAMAHADLLSLPVECFAYVPFADRVWSLRGTITTYDAWYVAVAEALGCALVTLDERLSRASGLGCEIRLPEA